MKRFLRMVGAGAVLVLIGLVAFVWRDQPALPSPGAVSQPTRTVALVPNPAPVPAELAPVPAPSPAGKPAGRELKLSDPRSSCATVLAAFRARDIETIRAAILGPEAERVGVFCRAMPVIFALSDFTEVCAERFGGVDEANALRGWSPAKLEELIARMPIAELQVAGDKATLDVATASDPQLRAPLPLVFRQVEGAWGLDLGDQEPSRKERLWAAHTETLCAIIQETLMEVRAGQYQSGREAMRAIEAKAEAQIERTKTSP